MKGRNNPWAALSVFLSVILAASPLALNASSLPESETARSAGGTQEGWTFKLNDSQVQALREAGCAFDEEDAKLADKLAGRGFTAGIFVSAYQEWAKAKFESKADIEDVAVFLELGLPLSELSDFQSWKASGGTLTQFYNKRMGGKGQKIGGIVALAFGLVDFIPGAMFFFARNDIAALYDHNQVGHDPDYWKGWGIGLMITGVIASSVGLTLMISGSAKVKRWAPEGLFDTGDVQQLSKHRVGRPPVIEDSVLLTIAPYASRSGGGLALTLRF